MSRRAQASGAVGSIIDGRFRDLQEHRALNYPVFARDLSTAPPYELVKVAGINQPVKLQTSEQDIDVRPGDYLIGDLNGVVVLPRELAHQVLPMMRKQVAANEKVAKAIMNGSKFVDATKKFR
jgi:regulator of RNase E activity RraA